MPHEITVPLQEIKAVLAGARRVQNDLRMKAYWDRVTEAGLNETLLTGSNEAVLEADVDAYGESRPDGGPQEITHRFRGGILHQLGVPQELLLHANRLGASLEAEMAERISDVVQKGLEAGEQLRAVATLQSVSRTVAARTRDLEPCTTRLDRSARALDSHSQQLLISAGEIGAERITQILHRKSELAERQAGLEGYRQRLHHRLEVARQRVQNGGLPEVVTVAAVASGLKQAGQDVEVESDGTTLVESIVLKLADKIAFR